MSARPAELRIDRVCTAVKGGDDDATVAGPRTVAYEGREYRLTPQTKKLRGTGKRVTATYYWKYRGATLHSILEGLPREDAE